MKILESSQTLLHVLKRQQLSLVQNQTRVQEAQAGLALVALAR